MRQIVFSLVCLLALGTACACRPNSQPPADFKPEGLDARRLDQEANSIVALGYPVAQRDLREFSIRQPDRDKPLQLAEVEVTLRVLRVFKGPALPEEIRYRHYDQRGYLIHFGPPTGPAGRMGSVGIFFLRRQPGDSFRSAVDIHRPDIPTPWLSGSPPLPTCPSPSDCIARFLLTFHQGDDPASFSARLMENMMLSRHLTGFLETFELLGSLIAPPYPDQVRQAACTQLAEAYALEFPAACAPLLAGSPAEHDRLPRAATLRERLARGRLAWVQERIQSKDQAEAARYVQLLGRSADPETRTEAQRLMAALNAR